MLSDSCICDFKKYVYNHTNCGDDGIHQMVGEFCTDSSQTQYSTGCQCYGGYYIFATDQDCVLSDRYGKKLFQNWVRHPDDFCDGATSSCACTPTAGACSGYTLDSNTCTGDSVIGEYCNNGCQLKWKCTDACPYKGTLDVCPDGYVCQFEECTSKFYISGCAINYKNYCTRPTTDCAALGYTQTAQDCTGTAVRCPYDSTKMACMETCETGSILYSDKSCSKTVKSGKTAIGVVFDTNKRLAVALDQASSGMPWSPSGKDEENVTSLSDCTSSSTVYDCNPNGKSNSSKIVSQYGSSTSYAAEYCASYSTSGTKAGDWFLPSMGELRSIYNAKTYVNASLELLGKPALPTLYTDYYYWSSTEYSDGSSWRWSMDGYISYPIKHDLNRVRPVVAF